MLFECIVEILPKLNSFVCDLFHSTVDLSLVKFHDEGEGEGSGVVDGDGTVDVVVGL